MTNRAQALNVFLANGRWQESALVAQSMMFTTTSLLCARRLLAWPTAYAAGYRLGLDTWWVCREHTG
jgi:hypothetical protein